MSTTPEQVDLAANLVALAAKLDRIPAKLRHYAGGLIVGWASPEQADTLAEVMEETARQVRIHRPTVELNVPWGRRDPSETDRQLEAEMAGGGCCPVCGARATSNPYETVPPHQEPGTRNRCSGAGQTSVPG